MVEMLAAIVIIALLAALATPSFIAMMRDRRVVRAGLQIAETFREARMRSLARGVAVTVQWDGAASAKGVLKTREALIVAAGQGLTKSCLTADWSAASTDTRPLSVHNFEQGIYELAQLKLVDMGGSDQTFGEICFAPDGTAHVRFSNAGPFVPLTGVPSFKVKNTKTNVERIVFVPPDGIARFAL
ncbi:MAG: type II secretion system protein GspH [Polyangiaceae bacterium]|nr:type II secretion system protein GspH [Polyangiaceae bacterium]